MGASGVAEPGGAGAASPAGLRRVRVAGEELLVVAGDGGLRPVGATLAELLGAGLESLSEAVERAQARPPLAESAELLAPVDRQEVWACGVTYEVSRGARIEESERAAGV